MAKAKFNLSKGKRNTKSIISPKKTGSTGPVNSLATASAGLNKGKY